MADAIAMARPLAVAYDSMVGSSVSKRDPHSEPWVERIIGSYRLVRKVGQGGMGAVYEAVHVGIGKRAAIKMLLPSEAAEPGAIERFFNEACTVNTVQHPSIVNIYEHGRSEDGCPYLVMDFLDGETLRRRIERKNGRLWTEVLLVSRQISAAMAAAHEKGVIHRDLKPDNIILVIDPESLGGRRVKILDFGIAKLAGSYSGQKAQSSLVTGTGRAMGTPSYMSPEQCRGVSDLTGKTDVYALGVMMYQMLAGRLPFVSQAPGELWAMHIYEVPPPLTNFCPQVSPALAALILRMLAKAPGERPSMMEVTRALEELGAPRLVERTFDQQPLADSLQPLGAPAMPSTLGSAASQVSPRRTRWPHLRLAGAALALLGVGALGAYLHSLVVSSTQREATVPLVVAPAVHAPASQAPHGDPGASPAVTAPRPPQRARLRVESDPPGATVLVDGRPLKEPTPTSIEQPYGSTSRIELRKRGYQSQAEMKHFDRQESQLKVILLRQPRHPSLHPPRPDFID